MTLKELKKIIAEEYRYWVAEQDDMPDMSGNDAPDLPTIDMDPDKDIDPDGPGAEDAAATLKDIFDMLKDFFEGDDAPTPPKPKAPANDKGNDKGDDKGDDKKDDKKDDKEDIKESKKRKLNKALRLLEHKGLLKTKRKKATKRKPIQRRSPLVERFKKLANIIK
jgi:hypothetical protein